MVSCSTGEEAHSVAMLMDEHIKENHLKYDFKIFASGVAPLALQTASVGTYSTNNALEKYRDKLLNVQTFHSNKDAKRPGPFYYPDTSRSYESKD